MASASGTTLYVATPLNGGVDAGNCQNEATPCATIPYAVSQAATSDTIDVGPGTFTATLTNALGVFLTIQGSSSGSTPVTTLEPTTSGGSVFSANRGGWTLDDLTVDGLTGSALNSDYGSTIDVVDSTVTNSAPALCACGPTGTVSVTDSTISGNSAAANVVLTADMTITASTIANNTVGLESPIAASISVAGTILSDNGGADCSLLNSVTDGGYNIDEDSTCNFSHTNHSQSGVSPDLGTLQDNGGPTQTMAPASGSPALDQIPPGTMGNGVALCPGTDQRGAPRPDATDCDIGAVEPEFSAVTCSNGPTCSTTVVTPSQTVTATGTKSTGTATVSLTVAPQALDCGSSFNYVAPVTTLTDTGLTATNGVEVTAEVRDLPSKKGVLVCYQKVEPSPAAPVLLAKCHGRGPGPCVKSIKEEDDNVVATLVVPVNDPRFHVGGGIPEVTGLSPTTAVPGKKLTIKGDNLSEVTSVTIGGVSARIIKTAPTKVKVQVPTNARSGVVVVGSIAGVATSAVSLLVSGTRIPMRS